MAGGNVIPFPTKTTPRLPTIWDCYRCPYRRECADVCLKLNPPQKEVT